MFLDNNRYALMRSAESDGDGLTPESILKCRKNAIHLAEYLLTEDIHIVHILHSPQRRATLTAWIVEDELRSPGVFSVTLEERRELDRKSEEVPGWLIEQEAEGEGTFALFVTHEPNIMLTFGEPYVAPNNEIRGEEFRTL